MRKEIAEDMDQESSVSESEEKAKPEPNKDEWETVVQPVVPNKRTSRTRQRNVIQHQMFAVTAVIEEESEEDIVDQIYA